MPMNSKFNFFAVSSLLVVVAAGLYYRDAYLTEKARSVSNELVVSNVLKTLSIQNSIAEANRNAREQITQDAQRVAHDVAVAVAADDCANQPVPAGAADRLRDYADSLRSRSSRAGAGQSDR
ncbi:hypothetical protein EsCd1KSP079_01606 [Escherichia sp. KS167_9B]|nr:hypothetical protein EsCd1KSP079_01606 [Escherichia sp. KS167_9B]